MDLVCHLPPLKVAQILYQGYLFFSHALHIYFGGMFKEPTGWILKKVALLLVRTAFNGWYH